MDLLLVAKVSVLGRQVLASARWEAIYRGGEVLGRLDYSRDRFAMIAIQSL